MRHQRRGRCCVTTDNKSHIPYSYLERPWHRCWWQTWSWGWGCCCPRGTWRVTPHSAVPGSPRCSGTSSGKESEPHMCHGGTAGLRTVCRHTLCPRSSLWSCGLEGTCAEKRQLTIVWSTDKKHLGTCQIKRTRNSVEAWNLSWQCKNKSFWSCTPYIRYENMLLDGYTVSTLL